MGEAERRTPGAKRPASYLDTGAQRAGGAKRAVAERIRTPSGCLRTGRDARRMRRAAVARVLRQYRQRARGNPHSTQACARRREAAATLAAGLRLRLQLGRASAVEHCGSCLALWSPDLQDWATGAAGLVVASVQECGHRLCPQCAPRSGRRNRRRILRRLDHVRLVLEHADASTLAMSAHLALDKADQAADFLSRAFAHVPPSDPWQEARPTSATPTAYVDDAGAIVLAAASPVPANHVSRELCEAEPDRVNRQRAIALFGWRFQAARSRIDTEEHRRRLASYYASRAYPLRAARDVVRAVAALARACAREEAAAALRDAEHPRRWRAMRDACASADAAAAAAAMGIPHGPPALHGRDAARAPDQLRHIAAADAFATRAQRALDGAIAAGRARLEHAHKSSCLRSAATHARAARALWLDRERARAKARRLASLSRLWRDEDVRFLTLTTPARPGESAADGFKRTTEALSRLTRSARWRSHVAGAIVRIEVERSSLATRQRVVRDLFDKARALKEAGLMEDAAQLAAEATALDEREHRRRIDKQPIEWWHPHIHIAAACGWWPQADLQALWRRACRDPIAHADIRAPSRGVRGVLDELTKYVTKPIGIGHLTPLEAADLCGALAGRSTLRCTGALRGLRLEDERPPTETTDGAIGDGYQKPIGYVDDLSSIVGRRGIYLAASPDDPHHLVGIWRDDHDAQEAVRSAKERAWDLAQSRRIRETTEELPPT